MVLTVPLIGTIRTLTLVLLGGITGAVPDSGFPDVRLKNPVQIGRLLSRSMCTPRNLVEFGISTGSIYRPVCLGPL